MQQTLTGLPPHGRRLARKEEVQGLSPRTRTKETASQSWGFSLGILNCYALFMAENFADMLIVGDKSNSLGRVSEVIEHILNDPERLEELYSCLFNEDARVRMRAADALEKICRQHSDWLEAFIDRFPNDLATSTRHL